MCFQVAGATEAFVTHLTFMWLFPCVDKVMFLEMGQLGEALFAKVTLEWSFTAVHSEMDLEV